MLNPTLFNLIYMGNIYVVPAFVHIKDVACSLWFFSIATSYCLSIKYTPVKKRNSNCRTVMWKRNDVWESAKLALYMVSVNTNDRTSVTTNRLNASLNRNYHRNDIWKQKGNSSSDLWTSLILLWLIKLDLRLTR